LTFFYLVLSIVNRAPPPQPNLSAVEIQARIKYQNKLPDIPFDPKFISYPFDPNRFIQYNSTTLEKNYKWDILNEQDLGVRIDLIAQDYNKVDAGACLHPIDEKLLEEESLTTAADQKRTEQHMKPVSWMRRNDEKKWLYLNWKYQVCAKELRSSWVKVLLQHNYFYSLHFWSFEFIKFRKIGSLS